MSFLADAAVERAIHDNDAEPLADRLDVRRASAFDLAAGVSPVTFLDEHFRSVPHLIGFSAERFYEVACRSPPDTPPTTTPSPSRSSASAASARAGSTGPRSTKRSPRCSACSRRRAVRSA
ncbi:MAG: hypothetical protein R2711_07435 [Acidimicrobiales bacterium]